MSESSSCEKHTTCGQCDSATTCDAATQQRHAEEQLRTKLQSIKHRLVVMSGKGGVGKTTVTTNLAVALAKMGLQVGILDGDVHGPNIPRMLGVDKDGLKLGPNGLLPVEARDSVKVMSMAFILQDEDTPVAWRGPMKHSLFQQFLSEVDWGNLDYLVVDLPPGTGDEPMSIAQLLGEPLWTIIVTTPQDVALLDSRKSVVFGKTLNMNVLGIIENMSGLVCPHCGGHIDLFKTGGGQRSAIELGVPFLGSIPIDPYVVLGGDSGVPVLYDHADSRSAEVFRALAQTVHNKIENSGKG